MGAHRTIAIVAAVNNDQILQSNLAASSCLADGRISFVTQRGYSSAAMAYNDALDKVKADIVVFAHQDVYLPRGWDRRLLQIAGELEHAGVEWGVLGLLGLSPQGNLIGRIWCSSWCRELGAKLEKPESTVSIDELVIVLNRSSSLRFDDALPGYHLYGTDIVLTAIAEGKGAYVVDAPVIHNTVPVRFLDRCYREGYRFMQRKWRKELPLPTLIVSVTRRGWPLLRQELRYLKRYILRSHRAPSRHCKPAELAARLGYDSEVI